MDRLGKPCHDIPMNAITDWLISERMRWLLWVPVLLGAGMALYYTLPREPGWWEMAVIPHLLIPIVYCYRRRYQRAAWVLGVLSVVMAGMLVAFWHTQRTDTAMLTQELSMREMAGRIRVLEHTDTGLRVTFDQMEIPGVEEERGPSRIRLRLRGIDESLLQVGQRIRFRAALMPPAGPVMPDGFDFARFFYFREIGAVGYGTGPIHILEPGKPDTLELVSLWWQHVREGMSARVIAQIQEPAGAVAAALMLGDRSAIDDHTKEIMQHTNLSHLLAISGLHMAMVTGWLFAMARWGLLLIPKTRLSAHNKQRAAWLGIVGGLGYLLVAGIPISAARAYVMVLCIFGAILLYRQAAPMRSLAFAAFLLLLYDPSNILEPGFQLSFAATLALIAVYEWVAKEYGERDHDYGILHKALLFLGVTMLTTVVAELATGPLVAYHFHMVSLYGLLANLLVMPIVTFLIMPALVISFFLMPLGLEGISFWLMEVGITWMLQIAETVSEFPGASYTVAGLSTTGMLFYVFGLSWLCLWQQRVRYLGAVLIAIGMLDFVSFTPPQLLISHDMKQIAARTEDGYRMVRGREGYFVTSQWAEGLGEISIPMIKTSESYRCDALGCALKIHNRTIMLPYVKTALRNDCAMADVIVAPFYIKRESCEAVDVLIDRGRLKYRGGHWLWLDETIRVGTTAGWQGARPWNRFEE